MLGQFFQEKLILKIGLYIMSIRYKCRGYSMLGQFFQEKLILKIGLYIMSIRYMYEAFLFRFFLYCKDYQ
jgi:hypothetical protein